LTVFAPSQFRSVGAYPEVCAEGSGLGAKRGWHMIGTSDTSDHHPTIN
jgi:hypothetical protein